MTESMPRIIFPNDVKPRVAMVFLWNLPLTNQMTGGILYGLVNVGRDLGKLGFDVRNVYISEWHKPNAAIHPGFRRVDDMDLEALNGFDFVIFNTPGSGLDKKHVKSGNEPKWLPVLKSIEVPFAVQIHDEVEARIAFRHEFFDHPQCRLLLPITSEIVDLVVGDIKERDVLVYPCFPTLETHDPSRYYGMKTDSVVTTCRITARKRIVEFVQQARSLAASGFEVHVHGADPAWRYVDEVKEHANESWKYHGAFTRSELTRILTPARFHYNAAFLKRGKFIPRIEISTVEAVGYGCCPILCRTTVPPWVDDSMAILVDTEDMDDLAERLSRVRNEAHIMNGRFCRAFAEHNSPDRTLKLGKIIAETLKLQAHPDVQTSQETVFDSELAKLLDYVEAGNGKGKPVVRFFEVKGFLNASGGATQRTNGKAVQVDRAGLCRYLTSLGITSFQSLVDHVRQWSEIADLRRS